MQLNRRYPGVRPFEVEDKDLFFGRDKDKKDLLDLISIEKLIVLFGKSGYGKSSLINAGLIPLLQETHNEDETPLLPIFIRLTSYTEQGQKASPLETLIAQLDNKCKANAEHRFLDDLTAEKTLWYEFKRRQSLEGQRFLLIFDQFEEFFSYPLAQQIAFNSQLAELLYDNTPQAVREAAQELPKEQRRFLAQNLEIKVLFAIRADRMSQLDSMSAKMPDILHKRYELKALSEEQAREAIIEPAKRTGDFASPNFTFTEEALQTLTQKLSESKDKQRKGIEAFQLQILCEYLEDKVIKGEIAQNRVEAHYFASKFDEIFEGYYHRLLDKLPSEQRKAAELLIEERLIFEDGNSGEARRLSVDAGVLQSETGSSAALLQALENTFLLRRESNSTGGYSYEVSHDTMIAPILKAKKERKAKEKEALEKAEAKRKQRRLIFWLVIALLALAAVIGFVAYVLKLKNKADEALKVAKMERDNAKKALADKEIADFRDILRRANNILERGVNCPDSGMLIAIDTMRLKYKDSLYLQKEIEQVREKIYKNECSQ